MGALRPGSFTSAGFTRRDCSRRLASLISPPNYWGSTRSRWRRRREFAAALRPACCSAGWMVRRRSSCIRGGQRKAGITAAVLAREGTTGPAEVLEGRFGLFASHLQDGGRLCNYGRISDDLGTHWESRNSSFKPFPAAHVLHPYISAILRLRSRHGIAIEDVECIECPVTEFIVGIVCEPTEEKFAPASDSHGRVSLQYSLAEALTHGSLGKSAYRVESLRDPHILALARRVKYSRRSRVSRAGPVQG